MQPLTLQLEESEFARLAREAARRGTAPETLAGELVRAGLGPPEDASERTLAALDALVALRERLPPLGRDEAEALIDAARGLRESRPAPVPD
jgi:hypothetical protein